MALIFADGPILNTVKTYIESVGRRRTIRHWNTLDSLECIYTGPTATVEEWIPKIGQTHPEYPSMTFDSAEVVNQAATITELRATYVGKFYGIGQVAVGSNTHWGESSWTTASKYVVPYSRFQQVFVGGVEQSQPTTAYATTFVSYSYVCRYQIKTATYKAISKNPDAVIGSIGKSKVLSQSTWKSGQSFLDSGTGVVQSSLVFEFDMIDRQVNSLNNGWYDISESWGPQPIITSAVTNL